MSDDFNKGFFGGGTPQNREERRGMDERLRQQAENAQRMQQDQERIRQARQAELDRALAGQSHGGGGVQPIQGQGSNPSPTPRSLKDIATTTALWVMIGTGLWFYFVEHQALSLQFGITLLLGYAAGAAVGVLLWVLGWVLKAVTVIGGVLIKVAVWGVILWVGFHFLVGR